MSHSTMSRIKTETSRIAHHEKRLPAKPAPGPPVEAALSEPNSEPKGKGWPGRKSSRARDVDRKMRPATVTAR